MLSSHLILSHPLLLLPSMIPSIRVFSSESVLHIKWPNYWSFSFSISPSNEYSRLISFRIDWFDLLAVQGTLLQHHSSKASILWCSASLWCLTHNRHAHFISVSSVQSLSRVRLSATPWTVARQASLSITNSWSPPKPMSVESVMLLYCGAGEDPWVPWTAGRSNQSILREINLEYSLEKLMLKLKF